MILVTFSVVVTIGVLNVNFRTPSTHKMAPWVRAAFIDFLPRYLFIQRPDPDEDEEEEEETPEQSAGKEFGWAKLIVSRTCWRCRERSLL